MTRSRHVSLPERLARITALAVDLSREIVRVKGPCVATFAMADQIRNDADAVVRALRRHARGIWSRTIAERTTAAERAQVVASLDARREVCQVFDGLRVAAVLLQWDRGCKTTVMESHRPMSPTHPLVLIVDGHGDTRERYAVAFASAGFEIVTAHDGVQAFQRATATGPDIVVTEVALPRLGGWALIADLKRDVRTRDIPIVVLTSHAGVSVRKRAQSQGCVAVLMKPCVPEILADTLRRVLISDGRYGHA